MNLKHTIAVSLIILLGQYNLLAQENYKVDDTKNHFENKETYQVATYENVSFKSKPKNIILFIGDGMGVSQLYAGISANGGALNMTQMKEIGFSFTQSANNYITDSAAGGTALACGVKTNNGAIGVDENNKAVSNMIEIAEKNGKSTGLVSTSSITHATPASFIAHQPKRSMNEEIAADFLKTDIDVFIGGGEDFFVKRKDERNLLEELNKKDYTVLKSIDEAADIKEGKLAVLTAPKHNGKRDERAPDMLEKSTMKAIELLSNNSDGFFLMVEGSQIDWGGHQNNISYITNEVLDMDKAIGEAMAFAAKNKETLVIVTADHETSGLAIVGGNEKEGKIKAGFATKGHTAVMVPVLAFGPGSEEFCGFYQNTEIFKKMLKVGKYNKH